MKLPEPLITLRFLLLSVFLFFTLVAVSFAGPLGVYLPLVAGLAGTAFAFDKAYLNAMLRDWGVRCTIISFVIISLSFLPSARSGADFLGFFDFLALPVVLPAVALLARQARASNVGLVSTLAMVGALVALAIAIYEVKVLGAPRAQGNGYSSPIFFSGSAVLLSFFCLLGLVGLRSQWRWLLLIGNGAGLAAAVLGGTRGSMLAYGLLLTLTVAYLALSRRQPLRERLLTIVALITTPLVGAAFIDPSRIMSIFKVAVEATDGAISDTSTNERLLMYQAALRAFFDSPVYGHGWWHRFEAAVPYMGEWGAERLARDSRSHLHNDLLNFGVSGGVIAILGYLVLMASPIISAVRSPRTQNWGIRVLAASGLVGTYVVMGMVDVMFVFEIPKSMYILNAAIIMAFFLDVPPVETAPAVKGNARGEARQV